MAGCVNRMLKKSVSLSCVFSFAEYEVASGLRSRRATSVG